MGSHGEDDFLAMRDQKSRQVSSGLKAIQTNSSIKNDLSVKTQQKVDNNEI